VVFLKTTSDFNFLIDGSDFNVDLNNSDTINISSSPRDYKVTFTDNVASKIDLNNGKYSDYIFIADKNIMKIYPNLLDNFNNYPTYIVEAIEDNKNIHEALRMCDFLLENNANRGTCIYALGGGIIQDLVAYAAATYKRGIPWIYIPTTLLGQSDSCVGGKTGLNYNGTKNLIALFSAPREIIIDINFNYTLNGDDIFSGYGEILRLAITGGEQVFLQYKKLIHHLISNDSLLKPDKEILNQLIKLSLSVKKSVVEYDEFELNHRKSMNYGHSIGHAIEAMVDFKIPHGQAVALGIMVENELAKSILDLSSDIISDVKDIVMKIVPKKSLDYFFTLKNSSFIKFLKRDKKVIGSNLKLAIISRIGDMRFIDFSLDEVSDKRINETIKNLSQM
jgi:3-dehydroquinate synthase